MKNARTYEKKVRKLLAGMKKMRVAPQESDDDRVRVLIQGVLEEDSLTEKAGKAHAALQREFVDFNELRVSPPKEIVEQIGKDYPEARAKAVMVTETLNSIFFRTCAINLDYMENMTKRDLRRHLMEIGLSVYAAAHVLLHGFDGHAIPVDRTLVESLKMKGYVHPESDISDVQGFLERIIAHKDARMAHQFFREYVKKCWKVITAKRRAEARRRKAEEEALARAEAEAERQRLEKAAAKKKKARKIKKRPVKRPKKTKKKKAAKKKSGKKTPRKKPK